MAGSDSNNRPFATWLRARIVADWRRGWRFWSVRLQALALASGTLLAAAPEALVEAWRAMPPYLRTMIPAEMAPWLPLLFGALAILARFIRQKQVDHGD
jgi:hypothetical protein